MNSLLNKIRKRLAALESPTIIHHYDADGISSAAIIELFLEKMGKKVEKISLKVLDNENLSKIKDIPEKVIVDFGTNVGDQLPDAIIIDHHTPQAQYPNVFNPHYFGIDGSREASTSSLAALITGENEDIALIGITGDRQPFVGINKQHLDQAIEKGLVEVIEDIKLFGRRSRPVHVMLTYAFPDFLQSPKQVHAFLKRLNIRVKEGVRWLTYEELSLEEKVRLASAIVEKALYMWGIEKIDEVYGTNYILRRWSYDLKEITTIVNATGRQGKSEVGIAICKGDLKALQEGLRLLKKHQREVAKGLRLAENELEDMGGFYLLDGRGKVSDGVIGVVISILERDYDRPLVGIAYDGERIKLSMRGSNIHVGKVIEEVLKEVDGIGGGHERAGGAHLEQEDLERFLEVLNKKLRK
ncbi:MAG: DHH family phosphoesterase [Candidatus Micrarchaeota archaeon]|nr:DHH family phosphoesterase [Candidatus Micrarchaeota archaeon]